MVPCRYPCQHARYIVVDDYWINNTTYCSGADSRPTTGTNGIFNVASCLLWAEATFNFCQMHLGQRLYGLHFQVSLPA